MKSGIYRIRNKANDKCYIGSAVNLPRRWGEHLCNLRHGRHCNPHLQAAFDKDGEPVFVFETLEYAAPENLVECEQHYFDTLKPEYNIAPTAGSCLGRPCSLETRKKMSKAASGDRNANYGKSPSAETRRRQSVALSGERGPNYGKQFGVEWRKRLSEAKKGRHNPNYGRPRSAETRRKISEAHRGKHLSKETKQKISEARRGKPRSEETRRKISRTLRERKRKDQERQL